MLNRDLPPFRDDKRAWLVGKRGKSNPAKESAYECGIEPEPYRWSQINIRYYVFAILFLIFDVEAVFLFPWAIVFLDAIPAVFYEMLIFIGIRVVNGKIQVRGRTFVDREAVNDRHRRIIGRRDSQTHRNSVGSRAGQIVDGVGEAIGDGLRSVVRVVDGTVGVYNDRTVGGT